METVTITASENVNGKRVHAGQRDELKPSTIKEAVEVYGSEDDLLKYAWKSYVIEVQAQLRNGGDSKTAKVKKFLAKVAADPNGEIAQLAKRLGLTL